MTTCNHKQRNFLACYKYLSFTSKLCNALTGCCDEILLQEALFISISVIDSNTRSIVINTINIIIIIIIIIISSSNKIIGFPLAVDTNSYTQWAREKY